MTDDLGDRMKALEAFETERRFLPGLPIYCRIDGRGFSKFTRGMRRPFDVRMTDAMIDTAKTIVEQTHATIGYVQSDELSFVWIPNANGDIWFDRKIAKMTSVLAGMATAAFIKSIMQRFDNAQELLQKLPHFDARVICMPSASEASNMLLWRSNDCVKNSISMATSHYYSHSELQGKKSSDKHEMLFAKGINWANYPYSFKNGTFIRKKTTHRLLTIQELQKIPEKYRPDANTFVNRAEVLAYDLPPLNKISNLIDVLFLDTDPIMKS